MERKKRFTILVALLSFCFFKFSAQNKIGIYNAYIYDKMDNWKSIIDEMETKKGKSDEYLLELINYQYGFIAWCIGNDEKKQAKSYLKLAENNLEKLEKLALYPSFVHAYQSAFYGFSVGLNRLKAPFLGPKSIKEAEKSMSENPANPYGFIQYANAQYYMPPIFGGSKKEALEYYSMAQIIMEKDPVSINNDWNYLSLLTNMAQAYEETKQYDKAQKYYEYILELEPNF